MRTWMFVAEVFWLFLGMCTHPQSADQTHDYNQRTSQPTTRTPNRTLKTWYAPGLIRPPPLCQPSTSKTTW